MSELLPRTRTDRPRLRTTSDVFSYWAERIELTNPPRESFDYSSMVCEGDRLYHYGRHFELGRIMRTKSGKARLVLLNGDTYAGPGGFGPSTSSRQGEARGAVRGYDIPSLVVPFSALEAARVDFNSIKVIDVRDDRYTTTERSSLDRPKTNGRYQPTMDDPSGATKIEEYWDYQSRDEDHRPVKHTRRVPVQVPDPNSTGSFSNGHAFVSDGARRGEGGVWRWTEQRHWLGDSLFRARVTETRTRKATADELAGWHAHLEWTAERDRLRALLDNAARFGYAHDGYRLRQRRNPRPHNYREMIRVELAREGIRQALKAHEEATVYANGVHGSGRVSYTVTRWATYLSSFDYQEARPLYFLCELPHGAKASNVQEAIDALKPPEVNNAEARGLKVTRQGDLFAIPGKLTTRDLRRLSRNGFTKGLRILGTNHSVTEGVICKGGAVFGRGIMRHEPEGWRPPDHARKTMGDGKAWHLLVRNTVPRAAT